MPKKSNSLLLCFPTSSSTPSLAGAAGVTKTSSRSAFSHGSALSSSLLSAVYFFFLLFANVSLLCMGSLFLSWLEMPAEDSLRLVLAERRTSFISKFLHNSTASAQQLDQLLGMVQDAAQKGIVTNFPDGNLHHNSVWSFGSAFLFLTTIATTVGYGHAAPQTNTGKAFSMIYGTIAIPLLLAFFGELIRKLVALLNWIFMHTAGRRSGRQQSIDEASPQASSSDVRIKIMFVLAVSVLLIFSTIFVPALIFPLMETRWSFLDGLYYAFISMTTVGLGDVVPGEGPEWAMDSSTKELYHISISMYLLTALPLFFLAIKLISSLVSTAEMTFRVPFCADDGEGRADARGRLASCGACGRRCVRPSKPRIKVSGHDNSSDDDDDMYDASSGLIGDRRQNKIRADSETQVTSDGEDSRSITNVSQADDDDVVRGNVNTVKQTAVIPNVADMNTNGSFTFLFPQPTDGKQRASSKK